MKIFYHKLKDARKKSRLSQQSLAGKIGIAWTTYRGWENGKHDPALEYVLKISKHLGINPKSIINDPEINNLLPDNLNELPEVQELIDKLYKMESRTKQNLVVEKMTEYIEKVNEL